MVRVTDNPTNRYEPPTLPNFNRTKFQYGCTTRPGYSRQKASLKEPELLSPTLALNGVSTWNNASFSKTYTTCADFIATPHVGPLTPFPRTGFSVALTKSQPLQVLC